MAAAAALRRSLAPAPALLLRRQILVRLLSTQTEPHPAAASPAELIRIKNTIRSAATGPDDLAANFLAALPHPAFLGDGPLFSLAVTRLASADRRDLVASLLSSSLTALPAPHPSEGFLVRLIALYAAAGMPGHSLSTFRLVRPPTDRALSALLAAYHDAGEHDRAVKAFRDLPAELSIAPGVSSHNVLLKCMVATGDVAGARAVFDRMPDRAGVQPDVVSCNEVLRGYLKTADYAAFDQLLKDVSKGRLKPNVTTYNLRMAALCSKGRSFEAEELLDAMGAAGVPPNRETFNTIISGLCKEGEVGAAAALLKRMPEVTRPGGKGVSPDSGTYATLLEALLEKRMFGLALEVCKECLEKKWVPPFKAVMGLIVVLVKSGKVKHAKGLGMAMKKTAKGDAKEQWEKAEAAAFQLALADRKAQAV
jgi:pentatricopeptide repeat protein